MRKNYLFRFFFFFLKKYLSTISVLINCAYWDARYHRLITIRQMEECVEANRSRLIAIGDLACDPGVNRAFFFFFI